jgi:5-dehydro-4-deoxyglucarate dehydratase
MSPDELKLALGGVVSFPVTPFRPDGALDVGRFKEHLEYQASTIASALFIACGTGEGFSLSPDEIRNVIVEARGSVGAASIPIVVGVGHGITIASELAADAERLGADGVLIMPPYMVTGSQHGLFEYYARISSVTNLGTVVYQRGLRLDPSTVARLSEIPNVIAFKDGLGDLELMTRLKTTLGSSLRFMNGLPTAELSVQPYRTAGATSFSSAVLNFLPEVVEAFNTAVETGAQESVDQLLCHFYVPLADLRDQVLGYPISLIKAAVSLRLGSVGDPRPPLRPPTPEHLERLRQRIDFGLTYSKTLIPTPDR